MKGKRKSTVAKRRPGRPRKGERPEIDPFDAYPVEYVARMRQTLRDALDHWDRIDAEGRAARDRFERSSSDVDAHEMARAMSHSMSAGWALVRWMPEGKATERALVGLQHALETGNRGDAVLAISDAVLPLLRARREVGRDGAATYPPNDVRNAATAVLAWRKGAASLEYWAQQHEVGVVDPVPTEERRIIAALEDDDVKDTLFGRGSLADAAGWESRETGPVRAARVVVDLLTGKDSLPGAIRKQGEARKRRK